MAVTPERSTNLIDLWKAIDAYVLACGGDPNQHEHGHDSLLRQAAAIEIERHLVPKNMGRSPPQDLLEAIETISHIWERLAECSGLAEARMRILLKKVEPPKLIDEPPWLKEQIAALQQYAELDDKPLFSAAKSARFLVLACLGQPNSSHDLQLIRPILEPGPLGQVLISWQQNQASRLQWMVRAPELAWPGISVVSMQRSGEGKEARRETRTLHTAAQAVSQFNELLKIL